MATADPIGHTQRGFSIWAEFVDLYDQPVHVVSSSLATEAAVWVQPLDKHNIHLNTTQARALRATLDAWLIAEGDPA